MAARVRAIPEYVERFKQAFGGEIGHADDITIEHIGRAIAAFERELNTPGSRYDQFVGGNFDVFSDEEELGFELFFGKGWCGECHSGPMLSDFTFRVQGVGDDYNSIIPGFGSKNGMGGDFGRFHADEATLTDQHFAFRVLTIRNVGLTALLPQRQRGDAPRCNALLQPRRPGPEDISDEELEAHGVTRDSSIRRLDLTPAEIDAVVAFMRTTTAPV